MKKSLSFLFIIAFTLLSFQIKAQQVIASAGGNYEGDNISLSWTMGEPVTETFSGGGVILTQGFQQPYSFYLQQILNIPAGWSGVSSYIEPMNKGVEGIFAPYSADFIILASMTQFYYPETGVNTIGNWNYETGYKIKAENEFEVTLTGLKPGSQTLELAQGWNLLPVLSPTNVDVAALFSSVNLVIAKEVAGNKLYWPEFGINTLGYLVPGKAYFVLLSSPDVVDYSGYKTMTINGNLTGFENLLGLGCPWSQPNFTPSSHAIAFPKEVFVNSGIRTGDFIGVFTPEGLCAGFTEITEQTSNTALVSFSNDETTSKKDGFEIGEMLQFKLYRPQSNEETDLEVTFDPTLPNMGLFENQGLSAVKSVTLKLAEILENTDIISEIYPNPSHGNFALTMSFWYPNLQINIMDASGRIIKTFNPGTKLSSSAYVFNLADLPKGIYFLKLVDSGFLEIKKIVID